MRRADLVCWSQSAWPFSPWLSALFLVQFKIPRDIDVCPRPSFICFLICINGVEHRWDRMRNCLQTSHSFEQMVQKKWPYGHISTTKTMLVAREEMAKRPQQKTYRICRSHCSLQPCQTSCSCYMDGQRSGAARMNVVCVGDVVRVEVERVVG